MNTKVAPEDVRTILESCLSEMEVICREDQKQRVLKYVSDCIELLAYQSPIYSDKFKNSENCIENEFGQDIRVFANRMIIYRLHIEYRPKIETLSVPEIVHNYLQEDFERILKPANQGKTAFLTFQNSQFAKYIDTLCFNLLPLGNQGVSESGFSRSILLKQPLRSFFKLAGLFARLGGNKPLFEIHYNEHRFRQFSPEGWNNVFRCGAELLLLRPDIKGIFGASWFLDPQIETVSPDLKYIRELIMEIGGHIFFADRSTKDRENAFAMSRNRKKAFEKGQYDPASYIAIIPRKALLKHYNQ